LRRIGHLESEKEARLFVDYLKSVEIDAQMDGEAGGEWQIWVHRDELLARAKAELEAFRQSPGDPQYAKAQDDIQETRTRQKRAKKAAEKAVKKEVRIQARGAAGSLGVVTPVVTVICVVVAFLGGLTFDGISNTEGIGALWISELQGPLFQEVLRGQVWRVLTPIFIHIGVLHLGFNLMVFYYFGRMVEQRGGIILLVALILISGVVSNVLQYVGTFSPAFGGLSGVDYALFGFIWMKSRFDPFSGYFLSDSTVVFLMFWLVICMMGLMGPVANLAHLGGLGVGVVWGYGAAKWWRS